MRDKCTFFHQIGSYWAQGRVPGRMNPPRKPGKSAPAQDRRDNNTQHNKSAKAKKRNRSAGQVNDANIRSPKQTRQEDSRTVHCAMEHSKLASSSGSTMETPLLPQPHPRSVNGPPAATPSVWIGSAPCMPERGTMEKIWSPGYPSRSSAGMNPQSIILPAPYMQGRQYMGQAIGQDLLTSQRGPQGRFQPWN